MKLAALFFLFSGGFIFSFSNTAQAHFGMIIPSVPTVMENKEATVKLDLKFWHPFANSGMNMVKPKSFQVLKSGQAIDLTPELKENREREFTTWQAEYKLASPGLYTFTMEPAPYFEKNEDTFIIHYTKVYVDAFGMDEGWDEPIGLKTEIVPLSNPTGLYSGNVFRGQVLLDGQAVPGALVEVEWYPGRDLRGEAPYETMIAQTVKADATGLFTYAAPAPGWWGFAALNTADYQLEKDGDQKEVELGAIIWVYFHPLRPPVPLDR